MSGEIILGGKPWLVDGPATVKTWQDTGLSFIGAERTRPRRVRPNVIIWHWTGGENSAHTIYNTLKTRGLGVEFAVERDGTIYQYLDPVLYDPQDVQGEMGRRSVSIEVANYGILQPGGPGPVRGRDRVVDEVRMHGRKMRLARFYPVQIASIEALTRTLCAGLDIPMRFPREKDGTICRRVLKPREARAFTGILGHYHKTTWKADPGFAIFDELGRMEG